MVASWEPHVRLTFGGTLGNTPPQEVWSNTIKFHCQGFVPTRPQLQTAANNAAVPLSQWFGAAGAKIHNSARLSYVKLNWILANGKQRDADTVRFDFGTPTVGGMNTQTPPFYQTFAITLRTRNKRGRAHSGRIFPPMVVLDSTDQGTPYCSPAAAGSMASTFITMLKAVRTELAGGFAIPAGGVPDPAVFSPGDTVTGVVPLWVPIISAVVDRVPDVQHRRTRQIPRAEGATSLLDA